MTQPDPDTDTDEIGTEPEPEPDTNLADPDDYHRSQHLKNIHKARRTVHDTLKAVDRHQSPQKIGSTFVHELHQFADSVIAYVTELEPLINDTTTPPCDLPDTLPWDTPTDYIAHFGEYDGTIASYQHHLAVFRSCNSWLNEVKPLIEEDNTDEWEV